MEQLTKICTKCGEEKPLSEYCKKPVHLKYKYNRSGTCNDCRNKRRKEIYNGNFCMIKIDESKILFKSCSFCGILKSIDQFNKEKRRGKLVHCSHCADCGKLIVTKSNKKYRKNNRNKRNKTERNWRLNNPIKYHDIVIRHHKKCRKELRKWYIIDRLNKNTGLSSEEILKHPELIEQKRTIIKAKRIIKQLKTKNYATNES